jgi:hypothetical protein
LINIKYGFMVESKSLLVKQAKANENAQGFQNWNRQMAPNQEGMQSSMDDPTQLKSKEFQYIPNQKLMAIQKMANDSPNNKPIIQLKALANRYSQQKQPTLQLKPNNSGLPDSLKSGVENLSGLSMDDVKVHYNSDKPAQLNAHAYAQGTDIHLASGQEKHLPHEAWHVVQQKQGRVQPTMMMKAKVPINDDQGLEKEADVMGARALQMKPFSLSDYRTEKSVQRKGVVQKVGGKSSKEKPKPKKSSEEKEWDVAKEKWEIDALDKDLWFKASEGAKDATATDIELPKHTGISKAFHTTTRELSAKNILQRINPKFHNPASRFGGGFYVASDLQTCYAEIKAHEIDQFKDKDNKNPKLQSAVHTIEYDVSGGDLVDCTGGELVKMVKDNPKSIEKKVREDKRDGIVFPSTKGSGNNIVLFQNYGILKPTSDKPTDAKEGFEQFKDDRKQKDLVSKFDSYNKVKKKK